MRWIALWLLVCVACSDRYGAYLVVDGGGAIEFDRVEFYFGKLVGGELPTSPGHPQPTAGSSAVLARQFSDADVHAIGSAVGTLTYYVPDQPEHEALGHYVAVLAFKGEQLVGIGELGDFTTVTGEAVYRYTIDLVDARSQDVEVWGRPTADCMRWTRDRDGGPATVAVVRDDDADCDTFRDGEDDNGDCLPRIYCDGMNPAACEAQVSCVTTSGGSGCGMGVSGCSNLTGTMNECQAAVCVDERACDDCKGGGNAFGCVVMDNNIHVDTPIVVNPDYTLCSEPFDIEMVLPAAVECLNPTVVGVEDYMPGDDFTYSIASLTANTCKLTITPKVPGARFTSVPHMLITIDTPARPLARTAFVLGLTASDGVCQPSASITPMLFFGACVE